MIGILRKTLEKMSNPARDYALALPFSEDPKAAHRAGDWGSG